MMRKLSLIAAVTLVAAPLAAQAMPLNELLADKGLVAADAGSSGKTWYDHGTKLEYGNFDLQFNLMVQSLYTYHDYDSEGTSSYGIESQEDTSSFEMRNVRMEFKGNLLNKQFSYMVSNDFGNGSTGSDLKDAYLQWNVCDNQHLRMGQYKAPYSRQNGTNDAMLQLVDRSFLNSFFVGDADFRSTSNDDGRDQGLTFLGEDENFGYAIGVFNGQSDGEGRNSTGLDNKVRGVGSVFFNVGDYGSREMEGDWAGTNGMAFTMGASAAYGQGTSSLGDFDKYDLNVDLGMRASGFSAQAEYYYTNLDIDGTEQTIDPSGGYVQLGYFFVPQEWEVAARAAGIFPDSDAAIDNSYEYSGALGYYIDGHYLKVQAGVTWLSVNVQGEGNQDIDDVRYDLLLAGYF